MIIIFSFIAIFMFISIYLFYRAESIQKQLTLSKRETRQIKKNNTSLIDSMLMSAKKYEEFAKFRLQEIKKSLPDNNNDLGLKDELELITLLIQNYSLIYSECLKGEIKLQTITKASFDSYSAGTYDKFMRYIADQDSSLKQMWSSDNLKGYISLTEALILKLQKKMKDTIK